MKLELETRGVCFKVYTLQTTWIHSPMLQSRPSLSSAGNGTHVLFTTVLCRWTCHHWNPATLAVGTACSAIRRMQGQRPTNLDHSRRKQFCLHFPTHRPRRSYPDSPRGWIPSWCWQLPTQGLKEFDILVPAHRGAQFKPGGQCQLSEMPALYWTPPEPPGSQPGSICESCEMFRLPSVFIIIYISMMLVGDEEGKTDCMNLGNTQDI